MRKRFIYLIAAVVLGSFLALAFYFYNSYRLLENKGEAVKDNWEAVAAQYQERLDILASLDGLTKTTQQKKSEDSETERTKAIWEKAREINNITGMILTAQKIDKEIESRLVLVKKNPTLKSSEDFLKLQKRLQDTEQTIVTEQERYNNAATVYNRQIKVFPAGALAGLFKWSSYPYYEGLD